MIEDVTVAGVTATAVIFDGSEKVLTASPWTLRYTVPRATVSVVYI